MWQDLFGNLFLGKYCRCIVECLKDFVNVSVNVWRVSGGSVTSQSGSSVSRSGWLKVSRSVWALFFLSCGLGLLVLPELCIIN